MKTFATFLMMMILSTSAFVPTSTTATSHQGTTTTTTMTTALHMGYVPDGLTPEQYRKIRQADQKKLGKNLGRVGPRGFKSRSLQGWQEAMERGEAGHLFAPVGNIKTMRKDELPYMVRQHGSWDNSDVVARGRGISSSSKVKRQRWSKTDRDYANGGYKKEQSVSILGSGPGFNWTGEKRDHSEKTAYPGFF